MYIQPITHSDYFSPRTLASKAWAKSFRDEIRIKLGHFGEVVGNNCAIDASVIILPGRATTEYHDSSRYSWKEALKWRNLSRKGWESARIYTNGEYYM